MAIHFECIDVRGRRIVCERENWDAHVERHQEIAGQETQVVATIEAPMAIYQDARHADRHVYYRMNVLPGVYGQSYLRVIIAFRRTLRGLRGYFVSAHAAAGPKKGETIIWPTS